MGRLDGAVAIVTGASRGQGAAIARMFVDEGAAVVLSDLLDQQGEAVAKELGAAAVYTHLDVANPQDWQAAVALTQQRFGKLTVLVNNAGILLQKLIDETSLEEYLHVIEVNQVGCWLGIKYATPAIREAGGGAIVNTSSLAGMRGITGMSAYASSKFAIRGVTKVAALEYGHDNIRVNSIHPGAIDTVMAPVGRNYDTQPIPRVGTVQEIAQLVVFLCSDESSFCTGAEFVIDGGSEAGNFRGK